MSLTGKDVWDDLVRLGLMSGPHDPRISVHCANAERIARVLNETLTKRHSWLPNPVATEDAMRAWEGNARREDVLRLYKYLNAMGYTVVGIDTAIEREVQKRKATTLDVPIPAKKARP